MSLATMQTIAAMNIAPRFERAVLAPSARPSSIGLRASSSRSDLARTFGDYSVRLARYAFCRALSGNIAYLDDLYEGAPQLRFQFQTAPVLQPVFNPFWRLSEFWATHLYAGSIDPMMGDGKTTPSAVPIECKNDSIRELIGIILEDSMWEIEKTVYARTGTTVGDVGLFSNIDIPNQRTVIQVVDPSNIADYRTNCYGEGVYYRFQEYRDDPRTSVANNYDGTRPRVIYVEEGMVENDYEGKPHHCRFRTSLVDDAGSGIPYKWENQAPEWIENYPFLPLVMVAHTKPIPGCPFGQAEGMPAVAKMIGHDDIASRFNSFVRKANDPAWLFSGVGPADDLTLASDDDANKLMALYAREPQARAQALLAALNLADVDGHLDRLKAEIEDDYPELQKAIKNATGDASGVALRVYQQGLETKGQTRRAGYDHGFVHAVTRCIRMGAIMGFPGYEGFDPDSLVGDPAKIKFRVAPRSLFSKDRLDQLIIEEKEAAVAESWDRAGFPIEGQAKAGNWPAERLNALESSRKDALDQGLPVGRAKQAAPPNEAAATAIQAPGGAAP